LLPLHAQESHGIGFGLAARATETPAERMTAATSAGFLMRRLPSPILYGDGGDELENSEVGRSRVGRIVLAVFLGVIVGSLVLFPGRFPRFVLGFAYQGPLVEVLRWQRWVEANPDLFGPLGETARFAIAESPNDSTALILTRTRDGVSVVKTHFLLFRKVPVLLALSPATAEELLLLNQKQGNRFWDAMKFLVQHRKIVAYVFAPRKELDRVGLTGFFQVIDVIPPEK
jgi:hypothetical protein